MPQPTTSLATMRPDLAASFMEFDLEIQRRGFIGPRIMPVLETMKSAGPFGRIPIEQLLQSPDVERAPGSGYARGKFTFTTDSFATIERGWEEPVDDNESTMYRDFFEAEQVSSSRAFDFVLRAQEKRISDLIFNATTWTGSALTTAITNEWDDAVNATPRTDVLAGMKNVWNNSGLWPDALIINHLVFESLKDSAQIIDRLKFAGFTDPRPGNINAAAIAQALGIGEVIVAGSPMNTAALGQAAVIAPVWSNEYGMVCKLARTNDVREPGLGRMFHWGEDGSTIGGTFESYRDEPKRSDIIRVRHQVQEKTLFVEAGHLLSNLTT